TVTSAMAWPRTLAWPSAVGSIFTLRSRVISQRTESVRRCLPPNLPDERECRLCEPEARAGGRDGCRSCGLRRQCVALGGVGGLGARRAVGVGRAPLRARRDRTGERH